MAAKNEARPSIAPLDAFDADELFALARLDIEKGGIADALWRLKSITSSEKVPAGAFSVCGQLYAGLGLWDHSLRMFQKHLERHPESLAEKFSLGLAHGNTGRAAEAMKIWDELLLKQPSYIPALFYRALARAQQGQFSPARQDLELLVRSASGDDPYLKPGKELLQNIANAQEAPPRPAAAASAPAATDAYAALARKAYTAGPAQ